jgi:hypothetical protein
MSFWPIVVRPRQRPSLSRAVIWRQGIFLPQRAGEPAESSGTTVLDALTTYQSASSRRRIAQESIIRLAAEWSGGSIWGHIFRWRCAVAPNGYGCRRSAIWNGITVLKPGAKSPSMCAATAWYVGRTPTEFSANVRRHPLLASREFFIGMYR